MWSGANGGRRGARAAVVVVAVGTWASWQAPAAICRAQPELEGDAEASTPASAVDGSARRPAGDAVVAGTRPSSNLGDPLGEEPTALTAEWTFDDPGADTPWDDVDWRVDRFPAERLTLGVEARFGLYLSEHHQLSRGPYAELAAFFDARTFPTGVHHVRVSLVIAGQNSTPVGDMFGRTAAAPLTARLRVAPVSLDLGPHLAVRVSGDVGVAYLTLDGLERPALTFSALGEVVTRWIAGHLEVGVTGGAMGAPFIEVFPLAVRSMAATRFRTQAVLMAQAAWVFR